MNKLFGLNLHRRARASTGLKMPARGVDRGMARSTRFVAGLALAALCASAAPAAGQATFEILGEFYIQSLSADATAASGRSAGDGIFETMRWTRDDGLVRLGMSSGAILGRGAGGTGISHDGLRVSDTIASLDSTVVTQGRWTKGLGWEQTMPPLLPDGIISDDQVGGAWDISGDGETVVGLYWRTGSRGGASAWTQAGGMVSLGYQFPDRSSRANAVNYDGTVIGGWSSNQTGAWQPTVWVNGVMTVLFPSEATAEVRGMNSAGTMLVGHNHDSATGMNNGTLWIKTMPGWQENTLGTLPGTFPGYGKGILSAISDDGSIIVGTNQFSVGNTTGVVWTLEQGLMRADDYFESLGLVLPEVFTITKLTDVTPDGRVICGQAIDGDPLNGGIIVGFLVTRWAPTGVPNVPGSAGLRFEPAYPNPFNPSVSLALVMDSGETVQLDIFDIRGRRVRTLHGGFLSEGRHVLHWDGLDDVGAAVSSGTYMARALTESGISSTRRVTLVK